MIRTFSGRSHAAGQAGRVQRLFVVHISVSIAANTPAVMELRNQNGAANRTNSRVRPRLSARQASIAITVITASPPSTTTAQVYANKTMVEVMGLEPTASSMRPKRSSQLSYTPAGTLRLARSP